MSGFAPVLLVGPGGVLTLEGEPYACALGKGGVTRDKREGDGATPAGTFPLRAVYYRPDKGPAPETGLPVIALEPADGWCDAPGHPLYNRPVKRPFAASHEILWREDNLYDLIVVIGHNDSPPVPGLGSAIFMHVAKTGYLPTEGCVALARDDLRRVIGRCGPDTRITIKDG